jgi:hypothetical protein
MDLEFIRMELEQRRAEIADNKVNEGLQNPVYAIHKLECFFVPCPLGQADKILAHSEEINGAGKKGECCFDDIDRSLHGVMLYYDRPLAFFLTHKAAVEAQKTTYKRITDTYIYVYVAGLAGNDFELLFDE